MNARYLGVTLVTVVETGVMLRAEAEPSPCCREGLQLGGMSRPSREC